jgi:drug/metabolite transporter (DMT)-like permease
MTRRRALARRNPARSAVGSAAMTAGVFAGVGGALGAATVTPRAEGAIGGAQAGLVFSAIGGLIVAAVSRAEREKGLVVSGLSLGGILVLGLLSGAVASQPAASA